MYTVLLILCYVPACQGKPPLCEPADIGCSPFTAHLLYTLENDRFNPLYIAGKFLGIGGVQESIDGGDFTLIGSFADAVVIAAVTVLDDRLIGVGEATAGGCIIKFSDSYGASWSTPDCQNSGDSLIDVAAGNGMVVAVGLNAQVRVSLDDGNTWQTGAAVGGSGAFNAVLFHDGIFYAGTATGGVYTSVDPLNVAFANPGGGAPAGTQVITQTVDSNGNYYAVDIGGSSIHKFDGASWTSSSNLFAARESTELAYAAAEGAGKILAVGGSAGLGVDCLADSAAGGVNFFGSGKMSTSCADLAGEAYLINRVTFYNGGFIASGLETGAGTQVGILLRSANGDPFSWSADITDNQTLFLDFFAPFGTGSVSY